MKDCNPCEKPTLEQFMKDRNPWEGPQHGVREECEEKGEAETKHCKQTATHIPHPPCVTWSGKRC